MTSDVSQTATRNSQLALPYTELHCHSYFSLLDGASSPEELATTAHSSGLSALALTDHDSLAGAVRFWRAANKAGLHPVIGAEVTLDDGSHLTLLAENQTGYANLCRLLTAAHLGDDRPQTADGGRTEGAISPSPQSPISNLQSPPSPWPGKIPPVLPWETLARHNAGLLCLSGCREGAVARSLLAGDEVKARKDAERLLDIFGRDHLWVEVQHHNLPEDDRLVRGLVNLAKGLEIPVVATGNVHYARREQSRLRDCLIAIRYNQTLTEARRAGHLPFNSHYALASGAEMARRFREIPQAVAASAEIARRCQVSLDFSGNRLPHFATPKGQSEFAFLYQLCHDALPQRYPQLRPQVLTQLAHELAVIEQAGLAGYFLIVWDIVRFARETGIRCQGRGSAANSLVAYLLGITSIDPLQHNLLFERFLSADKFTMPDIDIDFAADRREEVIQYVYACYGPEHTAMVCNVVTFQRRSALRDIAKVLDFPQPVIDRLAKRDARGELRGEVDEMLAGEKDDALPATRNSQFATHPLDILFDLISQLEGYPRHLSIHTGGMLITGPRLDEVVPLERATMPGRVVCQWDKDSVEDAGLVKIDLLGLRTLGAVSECLAWIGRQGSEPPEVDSLPLDDPAIYGMLQRGDTIGAFQVESRAQQQMLPRLKPTRFEDMIVEVAIVRPGPIQGGAVHPYLRRRSGQEPVAYAHPSLEPVLAETLGVLLFQEQAIRVAVAAAGFTPSEADLLRRAISRSRSVEAMAEMRTLFLQKCQMQAIDEQTAAEIFVQLEGFAGFGFCKSHAASFALIAYQTLHLKRYHPAAYVCALLNHQPMGFYSSEVLIGDAKRHGVAFLPPDVIHSDWGAILKQDERGKWAVRLGMGSVSGLGQTAWERIAAARTVALFADLGDFCRRTRMPRSLVGDLIRAGPLDSLGERRALLWQLGEVDYRDNGLELETLTASVTLPSLDPLEQTGWEYELLGFSPAGQLLRHYRESLRRAGVVRCADVKECRAGRRLWTAGMAVVRQRPATAKGVTFLSLEDESGLLDVVLKPQVYERCRAVLHTSPLLLVQGIVQREGRSVSLLGLGVQALG